MLVLPPYMSHTGLLQKITNINESINGSPRISDFQRSCLEELLASTTTFVNGVAAQYPHSNFPPHLHYKIDCVIGHIKQLVDGRIGRVHKETPIEYSTNSPKQFRSPNPNEYKSPNPNDYKSPNRPNGFKSVEQSPVNYSVPQVHDSESEFDDESDTENLPNHEFTPQSSFTPISGFNQDPMFLRTQDNPQEYNQDYRDTTKDPMRRMSVPSFVTPSSAHVPTRSDFDMGQFDQSQGPLGNQFGGRPKSMMFPSQVPYHARQQLMQSQFSQNSYHSDFRNQNMASQYNQNQNPNHNQNQQNHFHSQHNLQPNSQLMNPQKSPVLYLKSPKHSQSPQFQHNFQSSPQYNFPNIHQLSNFQTAPQLSNFQNAQVPNFQQFQDTFQNDFPQSNFQSLNDFQKYPNERPQLQQNHRGHQHLNLLAPHNKRSSIAATNYQPNYRNSYVGKNRG